MCIQILGKACRYTAQHILPSLPYVSAFSPLQICHGLLELTNALMLYLCPQIKTNTKLQQKLKQINQVDCVLDTDQSHLHGRMVCLSLLKQCVMRCTASILQELDDKLLQKWDAQGPQKVFETPKH